jgi:hypothetical protein
MSTFWPLTCSEKRTTKSPLPEKQHVFHDVLFTDSSNVHLGVSLKEIVMKTIEGYECIFEDRIDLFFYNESKNQTRFLKTVKKIDNFFILDFLHLNDIFFNKNNFYWTLNKMTLNEMKNFVFLQKRSFFTKMNTTNFLKARKKIERNHISKKDKINQITQLEKEFIIANNIKELPEELKSKIL